VPFVFEFLNWDYNSKHETTSPLSWLVFCVRK
jgi:hypothetical protein